MKNLNCIQALGLALSSIEKTRYRYCETKRIYSDRTFSGNRYYCAVNGNIDAGSGESKEADKGDYLSG